MKISGKIFRIFFKKTGHKEIKRYPVVARWRDDIYFVEAAIDDALRANFGYGKYDATEQEISRVKVEVTDYNDYEARLQYLPSLNDGPG